MTVIRGSSFQVCVNQAIERGLGIPASTLKSEGQWRFIYLTK